MNESKLFNLNGCANARDIKNNYVDNMQVETQLLSYCPYVEKKQTTADIEWKDVIGKWNVV